VIVTVVAAIIRRQGKILITRRREGAHLGGLWEFPGGKVENDESLRSALIREIGEELGVQVRVGDEFLTVEHQYPARTVKLHFFNCTIEHGEPHMVDVADLRWIPAIELEQFDFPEADRELIAKLRTSRSLSR
jgi:8-oxo-dGTP diphosphatase